MLHQGGIVTNGFHTMSRNRTPPGHVLLGVMPLFHTGARCSPCLLRSPPSEPWPSSRSSSP